MPFGILDTQYIDLPPGIDATYLEGLKTRAGVDFPQILRELDSRLGALNTNIDPLIASLITTTTENFAEADVVTAFEITERGEFTIARPQFAEGAAHMLGMRDYDVTLGFTEDGLESLSLKAITRNIDSLFLGWRTLYRRECLYRLFSDEEIRVHKKTTVTSPGFAGSGTGNNVFPQVTYPNGTALPGGYTHYFRDTAANRAAILKTSVARLRKWVRGPFDLIGSQSEINAIVALGEPDFVKAGSLLVRQGANANEALVDVDQYVGVFNGDVRVRYPIEDFSDANIAIFKSYGKLAVNNPLVWKYDELAGRNAVVRSRAMYPLADANLKQGFGINVNNRIAAVLIRIAPAGNYVIPTLP